jgi:predicted metal-dependent enzyme (double-stranded beta helix superfamily)
VTGFSIDAFVQDMRAIAVGEDAAKNLRSYMDDLFADPGSIAQGFPVDLLGDSILFEDETVSIWRTSFEPGLSVPAHDHQMSAVIGVYTGQERNDFFEADPSGGVRRSGNVVLGAGDVLSIGPSAIHSVTCLSDDPSLGLHVYLGNLTNAERSLFDIDNGTSMKFDDDNYDKLVAADRFA